MGMTAMFQAVPILKKTYLREVISRGLMGLTLTYFSPSKGDAYVVIVLGKLMIP